MKTFSTTILATGLSALMASGVAAQDKMLVGIVSIAATEANNVRYIAGAEKAAGELGWEISVVDAAGSADQANSGIQNLVQRGAGAIIDMVFPVSSIGAGLAAADDAGVPVVSWGGGLGGSVAATNGSGGPMAIPVVELMIEKMGGTGSVLALTYRTGEVCRNREVVMDEMLEAYPDIKVTKNEVPIPGYFEAGAQFANAWLASHPANSEPLAIWGCWDDPSIGAIGSLRQQGRTDVEVYGINGNAAALENIQGGHMTATAWQDSFSEGYSMVNMLVDIKAAESWEPVAAEIPAVLVTADSVEEFLGMHPEAIGQ